MESGMHTRFPATQKGIFIFGIIITKSASADCTVIIEHSILSFSKIGHRVPRIPHHFVPPRHLYQRAPVSHPSKLSCYGIHLVLSTPQKNNNILCRGSGSICCPSWPPFRKPSDVTAVDSNLQSPNPSPHPPAPLTHILKRCGGFWVRVWLWTGGLGSQGGIYRPPTPQNTTRLVRSGLDLVWILPSPPHPVFFSSICFLLTGSKHGLQTLR